MKPEDSDSEDKTGDKDQICEKCANLRCRDARCGREHYPGWCPVCYKFFDNHCNMHPLATGNLQTVTGVGADDISTTVRENTAFQRENPAHSDLNLRFLTLLRDLHKEVLAKEGDNPLALLINDTVERVRDMQGETRFINDKLMDYGEQIKVTEKEEK